MLPVGGEETGRDKPSIQFALRGPHASQLLCSMAFEKALIHMTHHSPPSREANLKDMELPCTQVRSLFHLAQLNWQLLSKSHLEKVHSQSLNFMLKSPGQGSKKKDRHQMEAVSAGVGGFATTYAWHQASWRLSPGHLHSQSRAPCLPHRK